MPEHSHIYPCPGLKKAALAGVRNNSQKQLFNICLRFDFLAYQSVSQAWGLLWDSGAGKSSNMPLKTEFSQQNSLGI